MFQINLEIWVWVKIFLNPASLSILGIYKFATVAFYHFPQQGLQAKTSNNKSLGLLFIPVFVHSFGKYLLNTCWGFFQVLRIQMWIKQTESPVLLQLTFGLENIQLRSVSASRCLTGISYGTWQVSNNSWFSLPFKPILPSDFPISVSGIAVNIVVQTKNFGIILDFSHPLNYTSNLSIIKSYWFHLPKIFQMWLLFNHPGPSQTCFHLGLPKHHWSFLWMESSLWVRGKKGNYIKEQ